MAATAGPSGSTLHIAKDKHDQHAIHIQHAAPKAGDTAQPIPIQLPTIYINPYASAPHGMSGAPGAFSAAPRPPTPPAPKKKEPKEPKEESKKPAPAVVVAAEPAHVVVAAPAAWWNFGAPHPLLWVTLGLSILAIVLGVPKGTLPTITGRHRVLRAQEIQVAERLALLNQLSGFLPPPLAALLIPEQGLGAMLAAHGGAERARALDLMRLGTGLQLWNAQAHTDGTSWWTIEDLSDGASVVRSSASAGGREREVWVLRAADAVTEHAALLSALTSSLLSRERLYAELDRCRAEPCGQGQRVATITATPMPQPQPMATVVLEAPERDEWERSADERRRARERDIEAEEERRRHREREIEVEERERDVARREKWVVESMRKLAEKSHHQASELTMEDRITERLKHYQRQLSNLHE
ncbi:hypothetical protein Q8F55_001414 [Vanrija albida]|uniref:Uncharacterized protein n=1 Tax=Vanrija albida TaxID=181172 RepID=A0ABR3QG01_9TREE